MKVFVNLKSIGKKKQCLTKKEYILPEDIRTVKDLILAFVRICVKDFNEKELFSYLTREEIEEASDIGKIHFGDKENQAKQDEAKAIENALTSYEDGIYRIFIGERECGDLSENITLFEGAELSFIKLAMLAGRMW